MLVRSPTTGTDETDLERAAPNGGVAADKPTTIKYSGTAVFMALMPVCLAANIPEPFKIPCFLIVGSNLEPVFEGELRLFVFLAGMFNLVLPDN